MRSWLAVLLWTLLLLQPGWAAMGGTGGHTAAQMALHHCPHAHAPCDAQTVAAAAGADHADCGTCHSTCNAALFATGTLGVTVAMAFPAPRATPPPPSHPSDLPERPQWAAPASS